MSRQIGEMPTRSYKAGDFIFREGDDAKGEAFMVHEGKIEIRRRFGEEERVLRVLGKGDLLGDLALFRNAPRSAHAVAAEPVTLLLIPANRLEHLVRSNPALSLALIKQLATRMLEAEDRLRGHRTPRRHPVGRARFFRTDRTGVVAPSAFSLRLAAQRLRGGIALGLVVIPVIFTIAEDALTSVPKSYTQAALALGAAPWQVAWQIVLPAALPGVFAACELGFGRAIGETMIVLMASGNAAVLSASLTDSVRTFSATIAAELAEVVFGGAHYSVLFFIGTLLFIFTFIINLFHRVGEVGGDEIVGFHDE